MAGTYRQPKEHPLAPIPMSVARPGYDNARFIWAGAHYCRKYAAYFLEWGSVVA